MPYFSQLLSIVSPVRPKQVRMASGQGWSWAKRLQPGAEAYVLPSGGLRYRSPSSPYLAPGNKPLLNFTVPEGDLDLVELLRQAASE